MKRIKGATRKLHRILIQAVSDYYGIGTNIRVTEYLEGGKVKLNETELADAWKIKQNIQDPIYIASLMAGNR